MKTIVLDIETNGLLKPWENEDGQPVSKIHCVSVKELGKAETEKSFTNKHEFATYLDGVHCIVCHNIICYDLPVLKQLGWIDDYTIEPDTINGRPVKLVDTYILSRLFNPNRERHGLEWWGELLGIIKPEVKDWRNLTQEQYIHRCVEDVRINEAVYYELVREAGGYDWKGSISLEKAFQDVMVRAEWHGFKFDLDKAVELLAHINELMTDIEQKVNSKLPFCDIPKSKLKAPPVTRWRMDEPGACAVKYFGDLIFAKDDTYWVKHPNGTDYHLGDDGIPPLVTQHQMTIANQKDIKQLLLDKYDWKPTFWNFKKDKKGKKVRVNGKYTHTSPRFNDVQTKEICPDLERIGRAIDWVHLLCDWLLIRHRRNLLGSPAGAGYVNHPRLSYDGRLPSGMDTIGAATNRVTHRVVANLPRVATKYGKEIRELFCVSVGKVAVGYDASSLEDVLKAHYVYKYDKGDYAFRISQPGYSAHTENAELWGIDRSQAKTGGYALQFECALPTFCKAVGVDKHTGEKWYNDWWELNYGLKLFREAAVNFWKTKGNKKWVLGLDGRKIACNQEYMVVSRIIQSAGAIVMKRSAVILDRWIQERGLDADVVCFYHDEQVVESNSDCAELIAELGVLSITEAGKYYNLKVELTGEAKIGANWAEVH